MMDRLIWKAIDWDHKPITSKDRETARAGRKKSQPRASNTYRGALRNGRTRDERTMASTGPGYHGTIRLNRSKHWKPADNYFDARDLSQSNRPVV